MKAVARAGGRTGRRGKGGCGGKGGWKRCFGVSEGRFFGENKETGTSKRRIWARDSGLRPDSWGNCSNTKIPIRSALPRDFVGKSLGERFSWRAPSRSGVFENEDAAIVEWDFGGFDDLEVALGGVMAFGAAGGESC